MHTAHNASSKHVSRRYALLTFQLYNDKSRLLACLRWCWRRAALTSNARPQTTSVAVSQSLAEERATWRQWDDTELNVIPRSPSQNACQQKYDLQELGWEDIDKRTVLVTTAAHSRLGELVDVNLSEHLIGICSFCGWVFDAGHYRRQLNLAMIIVR